VFLPRRRTQNEWLAALGRGRQFFEGEHGRE
jgi:hypothetical protein